MWHVATSSYVLGTFRSREINDWDIDEIKKYMLLAKSCVSSSFLLRTLLHPQVSV